MDRKIGSLTIRELLGFALLTVLLLAGLLASWYMGRQHNQIARALEDSAWLALSGQWTQARETADSAKNAWEQGWNLWAVFADHSPMEEINGLFGELTVYGAAREGPEFARSCTVLARQIEAMANAQKVSWWNIL